MVIYKRKLNKSLVWFSVLFSVSLVIAPFGAKAAILYLEPSTGEYDQGNIFIVDVKLDSQGEYINTVEADLEFPPEILEVQDLSQGNSILNLWIEEPKISHNIISFIGGVPGGYQGANGLIGKIIFKAKKSGRAVVVFQDDSKVLLNDGRGTKADLIVRGAEFNVKEIGGPSDEWQKELEKDKIPPLPFKVEISQDPSIFEGKYYIVFSTTDKETGIDHYEILEADQRGYRRGTTRMAKWKVGKSPYLLRDQSLQSIIKVKAVDKAGNEWIEIVKAPKKPARKYILYLVLALILVIIIIGLILLKKNLETHRNL